MTLIKTFWALVLALVMIGGCATGGGYEKDAGGGAPRPVDFFTDTQAGRDLGARFNVSLGTLESLSDISASAEFNDRVVQYANVFNSATQDLRAAINAHFNGFVFAGGTSEQRYKHLPEYGRLVNYAHRRSSALQGFQMLVDAYKINPDPTTLDKLGGCLKELLQDAATDFPGKEDQVAPVTAHIQRIEIGGIDRVMDNVLGNSEHPRDLWQYYEDGSASVIVPLRLSGMTRVTNNIDKSPFMQQHRRTHFELLNVDEAGRQAFRAAMKSDVQLASDGNRQVDDNERITHGSEIWIERAAGMDRAYYLAWRGETMTKEEFARRYPGAEIKITLHPLQ